MGIALGSLKILMSECLREPFSGSVLQLGRQNIFFPLSEAQAVAAQMGLTLHPLLNPTPPHDDNHRRSGYLSDIDLFSILGFEHTSSMDSSDYEGATYLHDLNLDSPPHELHGKFDVILDGGTIEHVFHVPNALRNIHLMLKPGGRIIHILPVSNYIDHGFYSFSPTLFWDYYMTNGYEINTSQVFRHTRRHNEDPWLVYDYKPGVMEHVSFGGLDHGMYCLIWVATKTPESTCDKIPQQGRWIPLWEGRKPEPVKPGGLEKLMHLALCRFPKLYEIVNRGIKLPLAKKY